MPKVPLQAGQVADPFNNMVKDKQQGRVVNQIYPPPQPTQEELLMAAATMHKLGKLTEGAK